MSVSRTPQKENFNFAALEEEIQRHGGPEKVAWMINQAVKFIKIETKRGADQDLKEGIIGDLEKLKEAIKKL